MDKLKQICYTEITGIYQKEVFSMQTEQETAHYQKCQMMMKKIEKHNSIRTIASLLLLFLDIPLEITPMSRQYGIIFAIFALLYIIGTFVSLLFAVPETPKFCIVPAVLLLLGLVSQWLAFPIAFVLILLFMWIYPDYKKLQWLKEQSGYPHFNARFDDQMQSFGKEYQSEHVFDHIHDAEMKDAFDEMPAEQAPSTAQQIEMPDVPELPERTDFHAD